MKIRPRPLRVLIVSHHALPHVGGVEVLVDQEICALVHAGHQVTHVTSDLLGDAQNPAYPASVRVIRVPAWHGLERRHRLAYPVFSPRLLAVLAREVPRHDVVHAHGFVFLSSVAAMIFARYYDKPRILTDHGGIMRFPSRWLTGLLEFAAHTLGRITARLAQKRVAYNCRVLRELEHLAGTGRNSLFLPYPVDPGRFRPPTPEERAAARAALGWTDAKPMVLFVGRITPDKGVLLLLEAKSREFDLCFCGPGNPDILGLPRPGVTYLGPRPQSEVVQLYHAADLFVLPSLHAREGFPLAVREALACGLKVVMSYEWGYAPYRGIANLYFSDLEPAALQAAIQTALAAPLRPASQDPTFRLTPSEWVERLYQGCAAPPRHRGDC